MDSEGRSEPLDLSRKLPFGRSVEIEEAGGRRWRGTLLPPSEADEHRVVRLKLENGYNVGLRVVPGLSIRTLESVSPLPNAPEGNGPADRRRPADGRLVVLLTTGGTIASRVDYGTGGVRPVRTEQGILEFYPDLESGGPVRIEPVLDRLSEEITPSDWELLADRVVGAFASGARGVVIAHGTDTMGYTAAALGFLLEGLPGPVALVGAQRSPDRPSSDGFSNLTAAVRLARESDLGEVVVVMHRGLSDDAFAIHRGTRVRKMHASRRDGFRSLNGPPLGWIDHDGPHLVEEYRVRGPGPARVVGPLDPRAALVWFHPGLDPERLAGSLVGLRGIVLAGTGLGHVSSAHLPWIREAVARGMVVVMTTQCLGGNADPFVYSTGRELLRSGVLYAGDMLPETAYAKLLWALGQSADPAEVRRKVLEERAGELTPRHLPEGP